MKKTFQSSTIGLVTLDEMKAKQENIVREREKKLAQKQAEKERERQRQLEAKQAEKNKQKKQVLHSRKTTDQTINKRRQFIFQIQALSFTLEEDECEDDDEEEVVEEEKEKCNKREAESDGKVVKKIKKDPTVDTSFLPDREREEEENRLREELRQEWALQQQKLKEEEIDITFSYWDGSGHRRTVRVKKGIYLYAREKLVIALTC